MSKQFTAAAIMLLVQDGKIALDKPVATYLDGTPDTWKEITCRRLLAHTSGFPREEIQAPPKTERADYTREEIWKAATALKLEYKPGDRHSYSNLGYNVLAMVVEKVSGRPLGEFLRARIFAPLGMKSTRINDFHDIIPNRACGYVWSLNGLHIADPPSPTLYFGAGALVSNVLDLAKWDSALYTDKLLNADSRKLLRAPNPLNNGRTVNYGLGWEIGSLRGHPRMSHDGLLAGTRTYIERFLQDQLTVIVLTNQSSLGDPEPLANGIAREYLPDITSYLSVDATGSNVDSVVGHGERISPDSLGKFAGRYEFANNNMLTVEVVKGRLHVHLPATESDEYDPTSANSFVCAEEATTLTFLTGPSGDVTGIELQDYNGKRKIPRIGPLPSTLTAAPDPNTVRTSDVLAALKAISIGGSAIKDAKGITPGVRADFANPELDLAGIQSIEYLAERDVSVRNLVRHEGKVTRVLYYRWKREKLTRFIQVYLTADGLVTDEDVLDS